jgi:hypothetical protein
MHRLLAFVLVASLGYTPMAFAGESIARSGARHVHELASVDSARAATVNAPAAPAALTVATKPAPTAYQGESTLSRSGMSKSKKMLIYIGIGVGFAASAWAIDHKVNDITPSSLGTRQD